MRILVTGANGQLGHDVIKSLKSQGIECCGVSREDFDLADIEFTVKYLHEYLPDVVVHCAAYTEVDLAENEIEKCREINVGVTATIAIICKEIDAKLVYISTDYVFSGKESEPYEIDSQTKPMSIYGQSKLEGERAIVNKVQKHFIIRTSWAYGTNGNNFVNRMLELSKEKHSINVVADQIGSPTFTEDLASLIVNMISTEKYGIYHATNEGYCSWAEFAVEIFRQAGITTKVNFITSEQFPTIAVRPRNSRLSKKSLDIAGFDHLPDWKNALTRYLRKISAL
ncbi:dTDP-4-dehydrorhamnose reductase [Paenibacillus sp. GP183]|uniref:dTDP-4-dehydrorhamnose reductase n=1 Tax=Paenibacillus sp. GP183 TaxID=1882751 RepID=UPI00089A7C79|nr:dTDP-4-dehydrorhamnose reductase [Paenibacillus sp. GP183]SEC12935.1 dTDP-4-dehydrorhamnose reductase [Paenibacillus sp. GP183]